MLSAKYLRSFRYLSIHGQLNAVSKQWSVLKLNVWKPVANSHNMSSSYKCIVAAVQMCSSSDKAKNLSTAEQLIIGAVKQQAKMVFLPECFDFIGSSRAETTSLCDTDGGHKVVLRKFQDIARNNNCWLSLGGYHEKPDSKQEETRLWNSHTLITSDGSIAGTYHKTHLFDIDIPGKVTLKETSFTIPGQHILPPIHTPAGKLGLATCYDVRFPELSLIQRDMGAEVLSYPSAFTLTTGLAHWEVLLRARAIETQCWVIAAAQAGKHNEKRTSFGHAMIVDPWGTVVAQVSGDGAGICIAEIDLERVVGVRQNLPCHAHRRKDLYKVGLAEETTSVIPIREDHEFIFGHISIPSDQVFLTSQHSYAFVNVKPVVPGHVLVAPKRSAWRLTELIPGEVSDIFGMVQRVQAAMETLHEAKSSTVTIQDGPDAGQTVKHIHVHILPRKPGDFKDDEIYKQLEHHDKPGSTKPNRTAAAMKEEALALRKLFY